MEIQSNEQSCPCMLQQYQKQLEDHVRSKVSESQMNSLEREQENVEKNDTSDKDAEVEDMKNEIEITDEKW